MVPALIGDYLLAYFSFPFYNFNMEEDHSVQIERKKDKTKDRKFSQREM